jgi:hypothetical protein
MEKKECPICFDNLGRIYRTLQCCHKFHHKCLLKNETYNVKPYKCPFCRQSYENIQLRNRTYKLTIEEKKKKKNFYNDISNLIENINCEANILFHIKLLYSFFEYILKNIKMLTEIKYGFRKFIKVLVEKIYQFQYKIDNHIENNGIEFIGGQEKLNNWNKCKERLFEKIKY